MAPSSCADGKISCSDRVLQAASGRKRFKLRVKVKVIRVILSENATGQTKG
jgi:hypothetical protein